MTRRTLGYILAVVGFAFVVVGIAGLMIDRSSLVPPLSSDLAFDQDSTSVPILTPIFESIPNPTLTPSTESTMEPTLDPASKSTSDPNLNPIVSPEVPAFVGIIDDPSEIVYYSTDLSTAVTNVPSFFTINRITAHVADSPVTNAPADTLLLELAAVPSSAFTIILLVEADRLPSPGVPDDLHGLQWRLDFADGKFVKSARQVGPEGFINQPSEHFNTRYEGLGDHAEIAFYGPTGTRYLAVLITDGTYCSLILP